MMGWDGGGWWPVMWGGMAAFWLLVLAGAFSLLWGLQRSGREESGAPEIPKQRLARGDIDVEQYRALAGELGSDGRSPRAGPSGGLIVLVLLVVIGITTLFSVPAIAATRGNWNMGGMMGGGQNTANAPLTTGSSAATVTMQNLAFSPGNLQVPVGATVTWTNRDSAPHNATATDGSWKTDTLSNGGSATVTFSHAGEYDYYCTIHPSMKAHLSVK